jgi:hypothetical protein
LVGASRVQSSVLIPIHLRHHLYRSLYGEGDARR